MIPLRQYRALLGQYLRPQRPRVAALAVLLVLATGFAVANPLLIAAFIDGATSGRTRDALVTIAVWFMILAIGHQGISVLSTWLAEDIGWSTTNELRSDLAAHVIGLDMGFHKRHVPGELIERVDGDVTTLSNFFSALAIKVAANGALVVGILVMLWFVHPLIGLTMSTVTGGAFVAMMRIQAIAVPWWRAVRARSAEFFGFIGEQLGGTEDIRSAGATDFMLNRFAALIRRWLPEAIRARMGFAALWSTNIILFGAATSIAFGMGSWLLDTGGMTIGAVYLVFHYSEMIRHPIEQVRAQMEDLQKAGAGIGRVRDLLATSPAVEDSGTTQLPNGALGVTFDAVSFSYEDDDPALRDIDLELAPGRVLGLLGRTGSGKTTMARLVTRLYDPTAGKVLLGGVPTNEIDATSLRQRVAIVTQDVQLFRATVLENLTFFDSSLGRAEVEQAIEDLGLSEWLDRLPNGLDTMLASGSGGLSAGQAQLLAFARVFLRNPGLVVLDEASSRLDPATEALIERAVSRLLEGRTGIIIAHRLNTVNRAHEIAVLDAGRITEHGDRRSLAADPESAFARLLATGAQELLA